MTDKCIGWRTSSYSANDGACVEVGDRTEIAVNGDKRTTIYVRDFKDPEGSMLQFAAETWKGFTGCIVNSHLRATDT